jgi:hypothetical protein
VVFEQVCADLEAAGYEVQPFVIPAVAVNARTDVTGSGLLATPNTMDSMDLIRRPPKAILKEQTVTRPGRTNFAGITTPKGKARAAGQSAALVRGTTGMQTGLKLQPNFAAWMMGYPPHWTDLNYPSPNTAKSS